MEIVFYLVQADMYLGVKVVILEVAQFLALTQVTQDQTAIVIGPIIVAYQFHPAQYMQAEK